MLAGSLRVCGELVHLKVNAELAQFRDPTSSPGSSQATGALGKAVKELLVSSLTARGSLAGCQGRVYVGGLACPRARAFELLVWATAVHPREGVSS